MEWIQGERIVIDRCVGKGGEFVTLVKDKSGWEGEEDKWETHLEILYRKPDSNEEFTVTWSYDNDNEYGNKLSYLMAVFGLIKEQRIPVVGICDVVPKDWLEEWLSKAEIQVTDPNKPLSLNYSLYAFGTFWSSTDYGEMSKLTEDEARRYIKVLFLKGDGGYHQLTKFISREGKLAKGIIVDRADQGYGVLPLF